MDQEKKIPLVIIAGPTGSGKSAFALSLAKAYDAEIINLDAFQIYRDMPIGTAQPSAQEMSEVRHWLYGFHPPTESMSAAQYTKLAEPTIEDIHARGRRVLLVGGAGFYMRSLLYGLFEAPPVDEELRKRLNERANAPGGKDEVYEELSRVDAAAASRIARNDVYRVTRALEVYYQTGRPISEHHQEHQRPARFAHKILAPQIEKEELWRRQEARVRAMFGAGWEREVRDLLAAGVGAGAPGFRAIGYRLVIELISGAKTMPDIVAQVCKEHQQYAKRQQTWLRSERGVEHVSFREKSSLVDWWAPR